jgi:hypothetical protein
MKINIYKRNNSLVLGIDHLHNNGNKLFKIRLIILFREIRKIMWKINLKKALNKIWNLLVI